MLVLSRKLGEQIVIGSNVVLQVIEIRADRVKLAFDAPIEIPIHREEVHRRIQLQEKGPADPAAATEHRRRKYQTRDPIT